jgi:hypothetical protein
MGNYKEGYVQLWLSPETPMTVIESLVDLMCFHSDYKNDKDLKSERIERLKKTRKEKFFQGEIGRLRVEINPTFIPLECKSNQTLDMYSYVTHCYCVDHYIIDSSMFEDLYCDEKFINGIGITSVKNALKKRRFDNLCLSVRVNAKQYTSELDDLVEYLRPYLIKNHSNKVGHIQDEDGYLNKDIYLDRDLVKKQIATRKHICGGCENYQENFDCPYWKKCSRAFEIGKKSK